jgi:hypothetical protein
MTTFSIDNLSLAVAFVVVVTGAASERVDFVDKVACYIGFVIAGAIVRIDDCGLIDRVLVAVIGVSTECICRGNYAVYSVIPSG